MFQVLLKNVNDKHIKKNYYQFKIFLKEFTKTIYLIPKPTVSSDNDTEVTTESMTTPTTTMETTTEPIGPVDFSFAVERITENSAVLVIFGGSIVTSWDVYVYGENETLAQRMTKTRKSILTRIQISNLEQGLNILSPRSVLK